MPVSIAINGFGRIGRCVLRALYEAGRDDLKVVAINDLAPAETNAHLLRFDSVHGRFATDVVAGGDHIDVGGDRIRVTAEPSPEKLPWGDVDVALECTGRFVKREAAARHLENGAKRVLVSAPCAGADKTVVFGVNEGALKAGDLVVSNASCTTNCLAPVAKALNDAVGILKGDMVTIHAYTGDQPTLDTAHKDLYRARSAALSMIPTTTGAAKAVGLVLPELEGRLSGSAIRVPTPNVSCVDLTFHAARETTVDEVNAAMRAAAAGPMKAVLAYDEAPKVSVDFNHDPASSVFAPEQTRVSGGDLVRVLSWYDNEWGFSNRMLDVAAAMGRLG
ncbi:MAG: type I glyceraldehyde-3-phosphate dehydrogenase [Pseudomonadota bacterium]